MAIRKVLLPLTSTGAGEAALSTAWTVAQLWNAHMVALHVQMDLAPRLIPLVQVTPICGARHANESLRGHSIW